MKSQRYKAEELAQSAQNAWEKAFKESKRSEVVPPGFQTGRQVRAESGWTKHQFEKRMGALLQSKKAERKDFIVMDQHGQLRLTPHYRLLQ